MAKKDTNTTSIGFEEAIWRAADKLRGNLDAAEYKSVVIGLIFLKYISDKFEAKYEELKADEYADPEDKDEYTADNVFFVPAKARWGVISEAAHTPQIGKVIDDALDAIEADLVEGIVALPSQLFYSTGIPVSLWFLSRNKVQKGKTLFIDARNMGEMVTRAVRELKEADILRLAETFNQFRAGTLEDEKGYCAVKTKDNIKAQDYILTPGRYVGIAEQEDDGEPFAEKMQRLTSELSGLFQESHRLEEEIRKQLGCIGFNL